VGTFVASTGEAPGVNRIEIAGDRGLLIYENSAITFTRNELPTSKYIKETKEKMAKPPVWNISIPAKDLSFTELHLAIHKNFRDAILNGEQPVATLEDGVNSLDLANALLLSGFTGKAVTLPTDTALYDTELKKRIVCSRYKK
jgi:predicted dehydrogenase